MTYQQMEAIRIRALEMGLIAEWCGAREDDEAWLRVAQGVSEIVLCWFPGRTTIFSVQIQTPAPLEVVHAAAELVGLHGTLTAGIET